MYYHRTGAGIGRRRCAYRRPSQALESLEMGADTVLVNTAIIVAQDSVAMAHAFQVAPKVGALARQAGLAPSRRQASATSPLTNFLTSTAEAQS